MLMPMLRSVYANVSVDEIDNEDVAVDVVATWKARNEMGHMNACCCCFLGCDSLMGERKQSNCTIEECRIDCCCCRTGCAGVTRRKHGRLKGREE